MVYLQCTYRKYVNRFKQEKKHFKSAIQKHEKTYQNKQLHENSHNDKLQMRIAFIMGNVEINAFRIIGKQSYIFIHTRIDDFYYQLDLSLFGCLQTNTIVLTLLHTVHASIELIVSIDTKMYVSVVTRAFMFRSSTLAGLSFGTICPFSFLKNPSILPPFIIFMLDIDYGNLCTH